MDKWLASIYGTNGGGEDLEKTAQHVLLQKLAEEEGIDISGLSDEEVAALAQEVLTDEQPAAPTGPSPEDLQAQQAMQEQEMAKEAQAKFEEADFLGRVMAHSYTQELEKIAASKEAGVKDWAQRMGGHLKARTAKGSSHFLRKGIDKAQGAARAVDTKAQNLGNRVGHALSRKQGPMTKGKMRAIGYGTAAAGAAGAAGAGVAAHRAMSKEASAFEKLAELRAQEMLTSVGIDPATGQALQPQQPTAPQAPQAMGQPQQPTEQFEDALNQRALEMLSEAGYDPNEVVSALSAGGEGGQEPMQA